MKTTNHANLAQASTCSRKTSPGRILLFLLFLALAATTAMSAQPDLTRSTDNLSNLSPYLGDTVTASIPVKNQACSGGSAAAGAFHVGLYWSTTSTFSGVSPFSEAAVSGCSANGTVSISPAITMAFYNCTRLPSVTTANGANPDHPSSRFLSVVTYSHKLNGPSNENT